MINNNNSAALLYNNEDSYYYNDDPSVLLDHNFESVLSTYLVNYSDRNSNSSIVSEYFIDELHAFYTSYLDTMVLIEDIDHGNGNNSDTKDITEYTDKELTDGGFIKSSYVIHEHDSRKAPLHWDRFSLILVKTSL